MCVARFLGITAVLLSLGSSFDATRVLFTLLEQSSPRDQMLPTIPQLRDLLEALEPKIRILGSSDLLIGWTLLVATPGSAERIACMGTAAGEGLDEGEIELNLAPSSVREDDMRLRYIARREPGSPLAGLPCKDRPLAVEIGRMIGAMSEIERLGEASHAIFKIPSAIAAWVISLVKWCLGRPPTIQRSQSNVDRETGRNDICIFQKNSKVTVQISDDVLDKVHIQVFKKLESLDLLWEHASRDIKGSPWLGMINVKDSYMRE